MFWFGLLIFLIPIIEIWGLIIVGQWIGPWLTITLVMVMSLLGIYLARISGLEAYRLAQIQMQNGDMPGEAILDGFCILVGAVLLIIPGFLTDLIGIIFFIPVTRALIKMRMKSWLEKKLTSGNFQFMWFGPKR